MARNKVNVATCVLIAALFLIAAFAEAFTPEAKADISSERTFIAKSSDAQMSRFSANWSEAWGAYEADWLDPSGSLIIGGVEYGSVYNIGRAAFFWDSSDIPEDAVIDSAVVSFYIQQDNSTDDFNLTIQGTGTYPHDPAVASDYYQGWYGATVLGQRNTSDALTAGQFWNVTLNAAGFALISKNGTTRFIVRSNGDIANVAPTNHEWLFVAARNMGEAYAAKLIVSYHVASGNAFNYFFQGPYLDSGELYNGTVHVKLTPNANLTYQFDLTSDGVTADTATYSLEQQAVLATWNITNAANYTRTRYFTDASAETIYVCIPDPDLPVYLYQFVISDFVGVTDGFLESLVYLDGANRVVERQPINTINAAPFYMSWSKKYDMRVVADQGVLSVGSFTALAETNPSVIIPAGGFPWATVGLPITVNALRLNSTVIQVNYTDSDEGTYWVRIYIRRKLTLGGYYTDYYENTTANNYSLMWTNADNDTDYLVQVQAYRGTTEEWSFYCPYRRERANIWAPLGYLGQDGFPIPLENLPAVILIICSILAFSFWHITAGAWIGWAVTGVCFLFGWLTYDPVLTPAVMGLGAVICAGITIGEFKKGERQV